MDNVTRLERSSGKIIRYVRVTNLNHHGNVEFQFSIGDPSLYLEMVLPPAAFDEFCADHEVRMLTDDDAATVDANERRWRFGDDEQE